MNMSNNLKNLIQAKKTEEGKKEKRGPRTAHQFLAVDIAESFGKLKSRRDVAVLMSICKKYPDAFVRRIWGIVKEKNINNKMAYFLAIIKNMNEEEKKEKLKNLKIIFIGTSEFAVPTLQRLKENNFNIINVITQPDKPMGRKRILTLSPVKNKATEYNLPIMQPEKIVEIVKDIKKLKPDLIVMISYGQIIPKKIIAIPKFGIINIHPSLLPKYRGSSPIQTAILNQDSSTGVTIMLVDEKMDHGRTVKSRKLKVESKNYIELHDRLAEMGAELLVKILPDYIFGKIKPKKQNDQKATYTKILTRKDGRIDWSKKAVEIDAQIRAFYPWPGTWCYINNTQCHGEAGKKIKIIKTSLLERKRKNKKPGEIFLENRHLNHRHGGTGGTNKKMVVKCGQGTLILEQVQLEGKKQMSGEEFRRGNKNILNFV